MNHGLGGDGLLKLLEINSICLIKDCICWKWSVILAPIVLMLLRS